MKKVENLRPKSDRFTTGRLALLLVRQPENAPNVRPTAESDTFRYWIATRSPPPVRCLAIPSAVLRSPA